MGSRLAVQGHQGQQLPELCKGNLLVKRISFGQGRAELGLKGIGGHGAPGSADRRSQLRQRRQQPLLALHQLGPEVAQRIGLLQRMGVPEKGSWSGLDLSGGKRAAINFLNTHCMDKSSGKKVL